jgi:hypothetical protein
MYRIVMLVQLGECKRIQYRQDDIPEHALRIGGLRDYYCT